MRILDLLENDTQNKLPEFVAQQFVKTGEQQRGTPEILMVKLQQYMGGGLLSFAIEHVGDLLHRMTHLANYNNFLPDIIFEKSNKILWIMTRPYGFKKEMEENFKNNSKYLNIPLEEFKNNIDKKLKEYSKAHEQLPVYNKLHWMARQAAIALGRKDFQQVISILEYLKSVSNNVKKFNELASQYELDDNGNLKQFRYRYY